MKECKDRAQLFMISRYRDQYLPFGLPLFEGNNECPARERRRAWGKEHHTGARSLIFGNDLINYGDLRSSTSKRPDETEGFEKIGSFVTRLIYI